MKKELADAGKPTPPVATEPKPEDVKGETPKGAEIARPETQATPPREEASSRGSVFWPLVLGGIIAGVIGYLASEMDLFGTRAASDTMRATISEQETRLAALEAVEPPAPGAAPEFPELDTLVAKADTLSTQIAEIDQRLTDVEKRPLAPADGSSEAAEAAQAAVAAYERELSALQASVQEQRDEVAALVENAQSMEDAATEAARGANVQAALAEITAALNSGQPFDGALGALGENGVSDLPSALSDVAQSGVATLNNLQMRFPDSARASLSAARTSGSVEDETGVGGFLRRQLGARSVAPKEGVGPDAVLSRVEAAVRDGQMEDALRELDTLPEPAQSAMQDWLADARARHAAQAATQDLSQSLTAN